MLFMLSQSGKKELCWLENKFETIFMGKGGNKWRCLVWRREFLGDTVTMLSYPGPTESRRDCLEGVG